MKRIILLTMLLIFSLGISAQEKEVRNNRLAFGFQINQHQDDFGLGINLTSPFFLEDRVALRLRGNLMFNEHIKNLNTTWTPYSNLSVGLIGVGGKGSNNIRLYGEGGIIGLVPSTDFSSKNFVFGGYGLFGFEFFMNKTNNYFIEIGGVGTAAREEKIPTKPIYSNGLLINVGFRFQIN